MRNKSITTLVVILASVVNLSGQNIQFQISKNFINTLFIEKNYSKSIDYFDSNLKNKINDTLMQTTIETLEKQLGKYINIIEINKEKTVIYCFSKFEKANVDIQIIYNENDKITGFFIKPHKKFSTQNSLTDFTVPNGNFPVKGTLLKPKNIKNKVLIIFIHGSGSQDRDETIYENKPFKDLAENFLDSGITSYRYDKQVLTYPNLFAKDDYTIDDEVCNGVYTIVNFFKRDSIFKSYKIILLGHSLGAMVLPRIADSLKNNINGMVMLAANYFPLDAIIKTQYDYLYKLYPSKELKVQKTNIQKQIKYLNSKEFNSNSIKNNLPLNLPYTYWNSLKNYNQVSTLKKITIPTLILQGEKDYQVNMNNFKQWKKTFSKKDNFSFNSYPLLNHLMLENPGISSPDAYKIQSKVPLYFTHDIIYWINNLK